jgi:4-amino-4-deoxy-L-arabinose transferase-like glycosyltransferase
LLFVGMIAALLCVPFIHTIFSMGDEGQLLHGAERMLRGSTLYVDFFEFLPPGGFVLTAAWLSIAGISIWSARSLAILTIVGIACFTYLACRQASKNAPLSALLTTAWLVMSQGEWTQVNHHYFTTLFSMVAAWAALSNVEDAQRRLRWPLIAGTAAGTAAMVTPTCGALAMLAAVTAFMNSRRHRVELIAYGLGCALVPAGLLAYLIWHHALAAAFNDVILQTAVRYAPAAIVPFGAFRDAQNFPLLYLFPLAAALVVHDWRTCLHDRLLRSCTAFAIAAFIGCFPRADIVHIAFAAPLACPLLAAGMTRLSQRWPPAYRYTAAVVLIGLWTPAALSFSSIATLRGKTVPAPRGDLLVIPDAHHSGASEMLVRLAQLPSGDAYFFYPFMPMLPFLSAREQISRYDFFYQGFTLASQYQDACVSVMSHASWVVMDRIHDSKQAQDAQPREIRELERALDSNFELVAQEGTFQLRRRREGISDGVCANIAE